MATLMEERVKKSATVLGNASELVAHIVRKVAGNDIADSINGGKLTLNVTRSLAQARFKRHFETLK